MCLWEPPSPEVCHSSVVFNVDSFMKSSLRDPMERNPSLLGRIAREVVQSQLRSIQLATLLRLVRWVDVVDLHVADHLLRQFGKYGSRECGSIPSILAEGNLRVASGMVARRE